MASEAAQQNPSEHKLNLSNHLIEYEVHFFNFLNPFLSRLNGLEVSSRERASSLVQVLLFLLLRCKSLRLLESRKHRSEWF